MNELKNIINLFGDCGFDMYANVEKNYAETDVASLECICEFINIWEMLHPDFNIYINYDADEVIFDQDGLEYLGYWR